MEKVTIIGLEQGDISSSGNTTSNSRIRTVGYIRENSLKSLKISATSSTGKVLQVRIYGYSDNISTKPIFDIYWYNLPYEFNLSSYTNLRFIRIVMKYSDSTAITPEEISECTVTECFDWYSDSTGIHCENMPEAPKKSIYIPFPHALWRISGDVPTHKLYPQIPEKPITKPYPFSLWRIDYLSPNVPYHLLFPNVHPIHVKAVPQHDYILIYDKRTPQNSFDNNGLAVLEPISCTVTEVYNAEFTVTLEHPIDIQQKWKYIQEFNILKVLDQLFVIKKVEHSWTGNSGKVVAYAEHIFYHLNDRWIFKGADIYAESGYWLVKSIVEHAKTGEILGNVLYDFGFYSDLTSETVGFDMGQIGYYKWNPLQTAMTPVEMLLGSNGFTDTFGGELYRDNFYFSINKKMENSIENSFDIHVGLNLIGIRRTVDTSALCTDFSVFDQYGSGVSIYWTIHSGIPHHVVRSKEYTYSENYTESNMELLGWEAKKEFDKNLQAKIEVAVDIKDVKNNPEYMDFSNYPRYKVGDSGRVYDERLDMYFDAHIIQTVKDGITGETLEVIFSSTSGFTNMDGYDIVMEEYPVAPPTPPENPETPEEILDYGTVKK